MSSEDDMNSGGRQARETGATGSGARQLRLSVRNATGQSPVYEQLIPTQAGRPRSAYSLAGLFKLGCPDHLFPIVRMVTKSRLFFFFFWCC